MPPKVTRGSQKKQAKGRKRSHSTDLSEPANAPQLCAGLTPATNDQKNHASSEPTLTSKKAKLTPAAASAPSSIPADPESASPPSTAAAAAADADADPAESSSSAAAAASSSVVSTSCARLDLDSLSIVFSLLDSRDFLHAVRVSRHWRAARTKRTAWPAFHLASMIQLLRDDDFDNPQRRKFEVAVKSGNKTKLAALINQPRVMEMWRHVTEVKLVHERVGSKKEVAASTAMMSLLPQFVSAVALTLDGFVVDGDEPVADLYNALSSRLLMLGVYSSSDAFVSQLPRLSSLGVLTLGVIPAADPLLSLRQLAYLHIERDAGESASQAHRSRLLFCARLGYVIRWLSVHHALRSLSIEGVKETQWSTTLVAAADAPEPSPSRGFLPALLMCRAGSLIDLNIPLNPPLDLAVPCALSDVAINQLTPTAVQYLSFLPSLTRLQWRCAFRPARPWLRTEELPMFDVHLPRPLELALRTVEHLRVNGDYWQPHWQHLANCTKLRTVHLTNEHTVTIYEPAPPPAALTMSRAVLQSLFHAWTGTVEECRLELRVQMDERIGAPEWMQLATCKRLRCLELKLEKGQSLPSGLVDALRQIPAFQTLVLSFDGVAICQLPPTLLAVMARSRSFSTLHLHALSAGSRTPDFMQSVEAAEGRGLSAMLAAIVQSEPALLTAQTLNRLRIVGHHGARGKASTHSFRIVKFEDQPFQWQREY